MHPRDLSLVEVCRRCSHSGSGEDWTELIARLQPVWARIVYRVTVEWGQTNALEVDDIIQDICLKLAARQAEALRHLPLESESATLAWLKVMAANAARDFCKAKYAAKRGADRVVSADTGLGMLAEAIGERQRPEMQVLLREVDAALPTGRRERTVFWLYYRQGLTAREISAIPSVDLTAKGVESLIHRLTNTVREHFAGTRRPGAGNPIKGESASTAS